MGSLKDDFELSGGHDDWGRWRGKELIRRIGRRVFVAEISSESLGLYG